MEDFEQLNQEQQARWDRWQLAYRLWLAAGISLTSAIVQAQLAERMESNLDPVKLDHLTMRAFLLKRRADALKAIKRSATEQHLARVRMTRLFGSWKPQGR